MDPAVYDIVHRSVNSVPYPRPDEAPVPNPHYADEPGTFAQKPYGASAYDVGPDGVRPDVWTMVTPMVNPTPLSRPKNPPALNPNYVNAKGDLNVDKNGYIKNFLARPSKDINCE
jgi:hypothetical protein